MKLKSNTRNFNLILSSFLFIFLFIVIIYCFYNHFYNHNKNIFESFNAADDENKVTVITHIYNEEYLLPFWLEHHRTMFDHGIIIDYRSTDKSLDICREMCPTWEIVTTRNADFNAEYIDREVMDIESRIDGIKIALNTTEFLFSGIPLKSLFNNDTSHVSYSIRSFGAYSLNTSLYPSNTLELYEQLLLPEVKYHIEHERGERQLHNFIHGNYQIGRHKTNNEITLTDDLHIIWLGYFPLNEQTINRKMQIKKNIPESDKNKGLGFQHFYDLEKINEKNRENVDSGQPLYELNNKLYIVLSANTSL